MGVSYDLTSCRVLNLYIYIYTTTSTPVLVIHVFHFMLKDNLLVISFHDLPIQFADHVGDPLADVALECHSENEEHNDGNQLKQKNCPDEFYVKHQ